MANLVIVKGTIKYSNGAPAEKRAVSIVTDLPSGSSCFKQHVVYTNSNGFYIDTLSCENSIAKLYLKTEDCNGGVFYRDPLVPASGTVEINFTISCPPPQKCAAIFTSEKDATAGSVHFNSSSSTGENIVSRTWYFGDGDTLAGNNNDPHHIYKVPGIYKACLKIRSAAGCESFSCAEVDVTSPRHCQAAFQSKLLPPYTIQVNGNVSTGTSTTDGIVERIWSWGDGTVLKGNAIDPSHTYDKPGSYTVCLKITTAQRCSDSVCGIIVVPETAKNCFARFQTQHTANTNNFKFVIDSLSLQTNDTLSYFRWSFGDGTEQTGDSRQVEHQYKQVGTYTVCLVIKTKRNCEFKVCNVVISSVTTAPAPVCSAVFNWEKISPKKIRVNASKSTVTPGDSIVKRNWDFGDGYKITDNQLNPAHEYREMGIYNVCLTIVTARGCEKSYCTLVKVLDSINTNQEAGNDMVKLSELYPNPVSVHLKAVVYSRNNNVPFTISIFDMYGNVKWTLSSMMMQGNNTVAVPVQQLVSGPYILKIKTAYGVISRHFFKL